MRAGASPQGTHSGSVVSRAPGAREAALVEADEGNMTELDVLRLTPAGRIAAALRPPVTLVGEFMVPDRTIS